MSSCGMQSQLQQLWGSDVKSSATLYAASNPKATITDAFILFMEVHRIFQIIELPSFGHFCFHVLLHLGLFSSPAFLVPNTRIQKLRMSLLPHSVYMLLNELGRGQKGRCTSKDDVVICKSHWSLVTGHRSLVIGHRSRGCRRSSLSLAHCSPRRFERPMGSTGIWSVQTRRTYSTAIRKIGANEISRGPAAFGVSERPSFTPARSAAQLGGPFSRAGARFNQWPNNRLVSSGAGMRAFKHDMRGRVRGGRGLAGYPARR